MSHTVDPDPTQVPNAGSTSEFGGTANDVLAGYNGDDRLYGEAGNDIFREGLHQFDQSMGAFQSGVSYDLGLGNDTFYGGNGSDLLDIGGTSRAATLDLGAGTLTRSGEVDLFFGVERFELSNAADRVNGSRNGVSVLTMGGDDTVTGLGAAVTLDGGTGTDLLDLHLYTGKLVVSIGTGGSSGGSTVLNIDRVFGSQEYSSVITGTSRAEEFRGGSIADTLNGVEGNDTLTGKAGNDLLEAGTGADQLYGGDGNDRLIAKGSGGSLRGEAGNDTLTGGAGALSFYGGDGADVIAVGSGSATVEAGSGNDIVTVDRMNFNSFAIHTGDGNDTIGNYRETVTTLYGGNGDDVIRLRMTWESHGGGGNDVFDGTDGELFGEAGNDFFNFAAAGGGSVYGGSGNDTLQARAAGMTAVGGGGQDTFIFGGGSFVLDRSPGGRGEIYKGNISEFETLVFSDKAESIEDMDGRDFALLGGNDTLYAMTENHSYDLGIGNDIAIVTSAGVTLEGGEGGDSFNLNYASVDHLVYGGAGDEFFNAYGTGIFYGGSGDDRADIQANNQFDDPGDAEFFMESGDDYVTAGRSMRLVDLGSGNDTIRIIAFYDDLTLRLVTGTGADRVETQYFDNSMIEIADFDPTLDQILVSGVTQASDFDSLTENAAGVTATEGNKVVVFEGMTIADMTDEMFAPWPF